MRSALGSCGHAEKARPRELKLQNVIIHGLNRAYMRNLLLAGLRLQEVNCFAPFGHGDNFVCCLEDRHQAVNLNFSGTVKVKQLHHAKKGWKSIGMNFFP